MDKTSINHYTPESKSQSKQWIAPGEPTPKKIKSMLPANMASIFWDAQGIIFIDVLEKGKSITGGYYVSLLQRLSD